MRTKYLFILFSTITLSVLCSCGFLDINPKGEVIDEDLFEKEVGYQDALYGIYTSINSKELYGGYISATFPEVMARNFTAKGGGVLDYMSSGRLDYAAARSTYNAVWSNMYTYIGFANNVLEKLQEHSEKEFKHYNLYKGEALALRAMMHFDLVRLFAVDYNSSDNTAKAKAIPYVTRYSFEITPFSSVDGVYRKCIDDLKEAVNCLKEDESLMHYPRSNAGSEFTDCRITHINLYAAEALLARVYWMKQDLDSAAIYAKKVIDSQLFPLRQPSDFIQPENGVINMKETIFGLYATNYSDYCYTIFGKSNAGDMLTLAPDYETLYVSTQGPTPDGSDLRLSAWFGSTLEVSHACMKMIAPNYLTSTDYTGSSILGVNLIRIPEMYYIMAEALLDKDPTRACEYFDEVIASRGMVKFANRSEGGITAEDIYIERQKEFYGEGQQWFNMKRLKKDIKVSENITLDGTADATYRFLLPTAEDNRNEDVNN